jgi:hypothetical protein
MTPAAQRYGLVLLALAAAFAVQGIAPPDDGWRAVVTILLGAALLLALRAADMPPRRLRGAGVLIAAVVAAALVSLFAGHGRVGPGLAAVADALLVAAAPPAIVVGVLRSFWDEGVVTVQAVLGALCLYLLGGMFFAFTYSAIDQLTGDAFFSGGIAATPARAIYFSLATLTTVGYGDLTAAGNVGHTLSVTEALAGQIYLVTVVSVVVAHLVPRGRRS